MATTLPPDFKEFLKLLNEHDVQYLLIGGRTGRVCAISLAPIQKSA
jgi:hypothetical protein